MKEGRVIQNLKKNVGLLAYGGEFQNSYIITCRKIWIVGKGYKNGFLQKPVFITQVFFI